MHKTSFLLISLILLASLVACNLPQDRRPAPEEISPTRFALDDTYPVDPIFEEFYATLGGFETLGPALTPLQESGSLKIQYVEAALLVYDTEAVSGDQFRLAPLGLVFGIAEPSVPNPGVPDSRYVNGHVIHAEFAALYDRLGGARFAGRPLTEARYNPDKGRIEQYFENVGFYILDADPNQDVHLLTYGAFACDFRCRYQPEPAGIPTLRPLLPEPFSSRISQLGLSFVGRTISEPYINSEGQLEIIFENMVLATDIRVDQERGIELPFRLWLPQVLRQSGEAGVSEELFRIWLPFVPVNTFAEVRSNGAILLHIDLRALFPPIIVFAMQAEPQVFARPIVRLLGMPAQPLVARSPDPLMVFSPIEGELGHNVPILFDDFLSRHGGLPISGQPVTEAYALEDGVFRQCFENLCLDFDTGAAPGEQLKPAPLGIEYKERFFAQRQDEFLKSQSLENVEMQVWESQSFVSSKDSQIINVSVYEDGVPLMNREPELTLTLPDNTQYAYHFPPTGEDGQTSLELPPVEAPNGSLIAYEVCLSVLSGEELCLMDNYLVWNYR